jgi:hypothetical protein
MTHLSIVSLNASVHFLTSVSLRLNLGLFSLALVNHPSYGEVVRCK